MALLLLTVGLSLLSMPQALSEDPHFEHKGPSIPNLDEKLITGDWFTVALASRMLTRIQPNEDMRLFVYSIEANSTHLHFRLHRKENGVCKPIQMTAHRTEQPFQYKVDYEGDNMVYLEEADPKNFLLFCTHNWRDGEDMVLMELYSRRPDVDADVMMMFKEYCKAHGLTEEDILDLTKAGPTLRRPAEQVLTHSTGPSCAAHASSSYCGALNDSAAEWGDVSGAQGRGCENVSPEETAEGTAGEGLASVGR
ncbi:uterocalin-like [Tenrec ecaudatus]|uniref:uterocalin-like n=1 Tax=Tenrec ecaudatus TaxID=94439 RepID=UPI003F5AA642